MPSQHYLYNFIALIMFLLQQDCSEDLQEVLFENKTPELLQLLLCNFNQPS